MSSVTFSTTVGGDGSTVTDDDNATTGLGNGGALIRLVPMMQQVVNVASYVVSVGGGANDDAVAAAASAVAAGSSATAAAASYDSFDDRYLGSKTSDPSVDNDGNTLLVGALYWNSTSSVMKVWTGSAWTNPNPAAGYLALTGGTMTGAITFAAAQFGTNVNTFLTTPTSANLAAALTDETGTGVNVFNDTPTLITPILGTPQSGNLANCTFPTLNQNTSGYAEALKSATTTVSVSSASAPSVGQVLMATSSTEATWQTPSGGGAWIYIGSVSASASATVDLTGIDSTYSLYAVIGEQIKTSNIALQMQIIIDGTVFTTASYAYHVTNCTQAAGTYSGLGNTSDNALILSSNLENNGAFVMYISGARAAVKKTFHWTGSLSNSTANMAMCHGSAAVNTTGTMTGVRFKPASSTITSGNFHLYGIKNS
jgi:hypothetical protein